jgi:DNA-binding NarL/FixJ family response regulator
VRVALVDDSTLFRRGVAMLLGTVGVEVVLQASSAEEALACLDAARPDVVILDIRLPPSFTDEGLVLAEQVRAAHPSIAVLVLSTYAVSSYAVRLLQTGSSGIGYMLKDRVDDIQALHDALARVVAGELVIDTEIVGRLLGQERRSTGLNLLSERERDVLALMAEGRSNVAIGQQLYLSPKTVESHVASVFLKLGLYPAPDDNRRVLAVLTWLRASHE